MLKQITDTWKVRSLVLIGTCLKFYKLDPCHHFSSPGLGWDSVLKMTGVKSKKISVIDMYLFLEKGLRGGISYIAKRYAKANNRYNSVSVSAMSGFLMVGLSG